MRRFPSTPTELEDSGCFDEAQEVLLEEERRSNDNFLAWLADREEEQRNEIAKQRAKK